MQREFDPAVYMMASGRNATLYIGVTSNLLQRIAQHRDGSFGGFTAKYGLKSLVWFEQHATMEHAILREKQLKKWERAWKLGLIDATNPTGAILRGISASTRCPNWIPASAGMTKVRDLPPFRGRPHPQYVVAFSAGASPLRDAA